MTSLKMGMAISGVVIISTILFWCYKFVPAEQTWHTTFFTIHAWGFRSARHFVFALLERFVPLVLLCVAFIVIRDWYRHAFLVPIGSYIFRLVTVLNTNYQRMDDTLELLATIIAIAIVTTVLLVLHRTLHRNLNMIDLYEEAEERVERITREHENKR